jgi:predicted exporter
VLGGGLLQPRFAPHPLAFEASLEPTRVEDRVDAVFGGRRGRIIGLLEAPDLEPLLEADDRLAEALRALAPGRVQSLGDLLPSRATQQARLLRVTSRREALISRLSATLEAAGLRAAAFAPFFAALRAPQLATLGALEGSELAIAARSLVRRTDAGWAVAAYLRPDAAAERAAAERAVADAGGAATGAPLVEQEIAAALPGDLRRVTAVATAGVVVLLLLYYRRARPVLLVLGPLGVAWIGFAALAPPFSVWNILALPLVVGYGIDDHVFIVGRALEGQCPGGALRHAGRAVVLTSLATLASFASLALASFAGIRALGGAGALAVGLCLFSALVVLPALLGGFTAVSGRTRKADHSPLS